MEINISCLIIITSLIISLLITSIIVSLDPDGRVPRFWKTFVIYIFNLLIVLLLAFAIYYRGFCCG